MRRDKNIGGIFLFVLFLAIGLWLAGASHAQQSVKPTGKSKIIGYSRMNNNVMVVPEGGGRPSKIALEKNTVIAEGGKAVKLTTIKRGDIVTINYSNMGVKKVVKSIIVQNKAK